MKLDENERGNQTRLMKVKDMILKESIEEKRERTREACGKNKIRAADSGLRCCRRKDTAQSRKQALRSLLFLVLRTMGALKRILRFLLNSAQTEPVFSAKRCF